MIPIVYIVLVIQFMFLAAQVLSYRNDYTGFGTVCLLGVYTCLGVIIGLSLAPGLEQWDTATRSIVVTP